jgi:hypothetical protein
MQKLIEEVDQLKQDNANLHTKNKVLEREIEMTREQNQELRNEARRTQEKYMLLFQQIASRPTVINTTNNTFHLTVYNKTVKDIRETFQNYNDTHLLHGQAGLAGFVFNGLLVVEKGKPPMFKITNPENGDFLYLTTDGELKTDIGMTEFIQQIYPHVAERATNIIACEKAINET